MNFSKTTSYSLNILSFMAKDVNKVMSAAYLNKMLEIPYAYLRQVLRMLSKKGLITGAKGRSGGFVLKRDKSLIYLADIIEATEGLESVKGCVMGFSKCPFDFGCTMHPLWVEMRANILNVLEKTTLADLLQNINKK